MVYINGLDSLDKSGVPIKVNETSAIAITRVSTVKIQNLIIPYDKFNFFINFKSFRKNIHKRKGDRLFLDLFIPGRI